MFILNKSVKLRLSVSLGACILLLIVVGALGLHNLSKMNDAVTKTYEENVLTLLNLAKVNEALLSTRVELTAEQRDRNPASALTTQQIVAEHDATICCVGRLLSSAGV